MADIKIKCIHCGSEEVVKIEKQRNGPQRCTCKKCQKIFQTEYVNKGALPEMKKMIISPLAKLRKLFKIANTSDQRKT